MQSVYWVTCTKSVYWLANSKDSYPLSLAGLACSRNYYSLILSYNGEAAGAKCESKGIYPVILYMQISLCW